MRRQLVTAFAGIALVVGCLLGVPRAFFLTAALAAQEQVQVDRSSELLAAVLSQREQSGEPVTEAYLAMLATPEERISYDPPRGQDVVAGAPTQSTDADLASRRTTAGGGVVDLSLPGSSGTLRNQMVTTVLTLLLVCAALVVASGLVGYWVSGRLTRPFSRLATAAQDLGDGHFDIDPPHSRIPEAEAIGSALRDSAGRLETLVRRDRELAATSSHLLRTPVTALRLDLEDLSRWPETSPAVAAELRRCLTELDRLSRSVTELVDASRSQDLDTAAEIDLTALVGERVLRAQPRATARGHALLPESREQVSAVLPTQQVSDVVDAVIEHVLRTTPASSQVRVHTRDERTHLLVRVAGTVRHTADDDELGAVRELVTSLGGHLRVEPEPVCGVAVLLPVREPEGGSALG